MVLVGLALGLAALSFLLCSRYSPSTIYETWARQWRSLPPPPTSPTLTVHLDASPTPPPDATDATDAEGGDEPVDIEPSLLSPPASRTALMLPPPAAPASRLSPSPSPSSSSLAPPPTSSLRAPKPRHKVILSPGHSPLDWARLQQSGVSLSGLSDPLAPLLRISPSQLRQHNKRADAWSQLGPRVYNITPYLAFHPGGEAELMRAAGRDGTSLFVEAHSWVSWENMLENCLVGLAVPEHSPPSRWNDMD